MRRLSVATLNLASGRTAEGRHAAAEQLGSALAVLDADVVCLQEVDAGQPRSHRVNQAAVAAVALAAVAGRYAPTLTGTPSPWRTWQPAGAALRDPAAAAEQPLFGNALVSRLPVRGWRVRTLGTSRARLPMRAPGPGGAPRWWWVPDEPRVALAAELDGVTVVCAHLSFWPPAAVRQLHRIRSWARDLPGPVVLAGDLNLPGLVPGRVTGGTPLVRARTYPADAPRVQLDHLLALDRQVAVDPPGVLAAGTSRLPVGDHRAVTVTLEL